MRFVAFAIAAPLLVVLGFELALASTEGRGWPNVQRAFDRALHALPWPSEGPFRDLMEEARQPQVDLRARSGLARLGDPPTPGAGPRLDEERFRIYALELGETGLLLLCLLAIAPLARWRTASAAALVALTLFDLLALGRHRTVDTAPIRPLTEQSAVLGRLARRPFGTRMVGQLGNLPIVAGADPIPAYRTLDLPVLKRLNDLALVSPGNRELGPAVAPSLRAIGASVRIFHPYEAGMTLPRGAAFEAIRDPALASWMFGGPWVATPIGSRATTYTLWWTEPPNARAWLVPDSNGTSDVSPAASRGDPKDVLDALLGASPLPWRSTRPESVEIEADVRKNTNQWVILSQLDYPEWQARWVGPGGERPAAIVRVFGGWQGVRVPEPGLWTLHLEYQGRDARLGLLVSALAWCSGIVAFWWRGRSGQIDRRSLGRHRPPTFPTVSGTHPF
jgi:hypothetical protein